jgi:hypothetical protein
MSAWGRKRADVSCRSPLARCQCADGEGVHQAAKRRIDHLLAGYAGLAFEGGAFERQSDLRRRGVAGTDDGGRPTPGRVDEVGSSST